MKGFTEGYDVTTMNVSDDVIVPKTEQIQFIVPLTIDAIIVSCTLWLVVRLIYHGVRTNRFRQRHQADVNGGILYSFVLLSAVMLLGRCCCSILGISLPPYKPVYDMQCDRLFRSDNAIQVATFGSIFSSLWLRQRALYANPLMEQSQSKLVLTLSRFSVLLIPVAAVSFTIYFLVSDSTGFRSSYSGCIYVGSSDAVVAASIVIISLQLALLVLFIIPLRRHLNICGKFSSFRKVIMPCVNKQESDTSSSSQAGHVTDSSGEIVPPEATIQIETNPSKNLPTNFKIIRMLKRLTIVTAVCVATDVLATILVAIIIGNHESFLNFGFVIYDLSLLINVISVIVSFNDYKTILFPCASTKCSESLHLKSVGIATTL
ncbi:uncharacterized protein LOC144743464 [Ciona intestinalis]